MFRASRIFEYKMTSILTFPYIAVKLMIHFIWNQSYALNPNQFENG
jgi:hypothetical protein